MKGCPILPHHLKTIEFDKVRDLLAQHASFSASRALVHDLVPSSDEAEIRRAQDATEEARRLLEARPNTAVHGAHDIRTHVRRAALGGVLQPAEILEVGSTLAAGRSMRNLLARQELRAPTLAGFARRIADLGRLEDAIEQSIAPDGQILDTASDRLRSVRGQLRTAHDRLLKRLNDLLVSSQLRNVLQEPLVTMRAGRYVLPVKAEFRGRVRGVVHDQSASGATLFIEPLAVVDLANTWKQCQLEEQHEIERVLMELSRNVAAAELELVQTVNALAEIDLAFAKGKLAMQMQATRPLLRALDDSLASRRVVDLKGARHPLLRGEVVPIDIYLGETFDVLLITGPNTGGKTVALKTVGLLALMAQAGLQIPAWEGAALGIFSGVYADIGDEQSIEQNLSTFSSHVTRIVEIIRSADSGALVLLDEIGAGTDPEEGSALARAILQHLVASRVFTIATTHYSDLKAFAYATPRVENASVEFDAETLRPTFHLTIGLPGRSNALTIAERLGMPTPILTTARESMPGVERHVEELLQGIHNHLAQAQEDRDTAGRLRLEAERAAHQLRTRLASVEDERGAILAAAEEERQQAMEEVRREAAALRRELRGLRQERERLTGIEERIATLRAPTSAKQRPSSPAPAVKAGDPVQITSLNATGVVCAVVSAGEVEVEINGKRVRVEAADLTPTSERTPREQGLDAGYIAPDLAPRRITAEGWSPLESQLDLRGLTTEEARYRLDQYLSDAYMEGLRTVRIVHGKGTGAVRQAVRELLVDHPLVSGHEMAEPREGGEGATIVRLAS